MTRTGVLILVAITAGIAAVCLLPWSWLAPLSGAAGVCAAIFAVIVRSQTKTEPPANPLVGVLLLVVNLPEQPNAKVKAGWALTTFLVAAAFLVAIAVSVMVRAYV